jgi:hypothetical protein
LDDRIAKANYFTTGGAAGVFAAGAVVDFFTADFFTLATFFTEEAAGAAGAAGVVAGAVCANEIPARARVIERAEMVFICVVSFFRGAVI